MLLQLPTEVILKISTQLIFEDKRSLKTTCHKLNELISKAVLYEDLDFTDWGPAIQTNQQHKNTFERAMDKLINNKFDGSGVKVVRVDSGALSDLRIIQLGELFPNVRRFVTYDWRDGYFADEIIDRPHLIEEAAPTLERWRKTMEKIDFRSDWDTLITDLLYHKYPRLTELDIIDASTVVFALNKNNNLSFFSNAPALTTLTLRSLEIHSLDLFEKIHTGFPLLKTLRLFDTEIKLRTNATLPDSFVPINTLLNLELINSKGLNKNEVALEYILKKYPNLQHLVFTVEPYSDKPIKMPAQHPFNDSYGKTSSDDQKKKEEALDFESYFLSNLPKSIKSLTVKTVNKDCTVAALAGYAFNLTRLDLLARGVPYGIMYEEDWKAKMFIEGTTLEYVRDLPSLKTLKIPVDLSAHFDIASPISMGITTLYLGLYGRSARLNSILSMFPSLVELYIYKPELDERGRLPVCQITGRHEEESKTEIVYPNLRILNIERTLLHADLIDFISTALPNLEDLDLGIALPDNIKPRVHKIDLSNISLTKCNVSFTNKYVYCTVIIQNVSKRFMKGKRPNSLVSADSCGEEEKKYVEITANCVTPLKILGFPIIKIGDKIVIDI